MFRLNLWRNPEEQTSEQTLNQNPVLDGKDKPEQKCLYCRFGHRAVVAINVGVGMLHLIAGVAGLTYSLVGQNGRVHNSKGSQGDADTRNTIICSAASCLLITAGLVFTYQAFDKVGCTCTHSIRLI